MAKKIYVGLLTLVILVSSIYIFMPGEVKLNVGKYSTTFCVWEGENATYDTRCGKGWSVGGIEYSKLFRGSTLVYAESREVFQKTIDNKTNMTRVAKMKYGGTMIDTYMFDGNIKDKEMFPVLHKIEVINMSGFLYQYEAKELVYDGISRLAESPESFGRNMKVEWEGNPYLHKLYKYKNKDEGKLTLKWRVQSDYEVYYIRMFDPIGQTLTISSSTEMCGFYEYDKVEIINGAVVTVCTYNNNATTGWLNISAFNITIDATSSIIGNSKGYQGGPGASGCGGGQPGNGTGHGHSGTQISGSGSGGSGAGYGAKGGKGGSGAGGGIEYGSNITPTIEFGSGGGGAGAGQSYGSGGAGGRGGASVFLNSSRGTLTVLGKISMNATCGGSGNYGGGGGGGSGGGILFYGKIINVTGATLTAKGGYGGHESNGGGGGGGGAGGRIKFFYHSLENSTSKLSVEYGIHGSGGDASDGKLGRIYYDYDPLLFTDPPFWSNNITSDASPAIYSPTRNYRFNVTWTDDDDFVGYNYSFFEHNFTGTLTNYSTTRYENVSHYNFTTIPGGVYMFRFYSNDSVNAWNKTDQWYFTVNTHDHPINIELYNMTDYYSNQNITTEFGTQTIANGTTVYDQSGTVMLCRDEINVSNPDNQNYLSVGTYEYKANSTGNENYTSNSTGATFKINIQQTLSSTLLLDGLTEDRKYEYGTKANITAFSGPGNFYIMTDAYSENNLISSTVMIYHNYTIPPYWEKNFSANRNKPLNYNRTSANFTNNQFMELNLMQTRNLTNTKINVTGYSESYPFNWFIDILKDGITDFVFPGTLKGNIQEQTNLSDGKLSDYYSFASAGSGTKYINISTFDDIVKFSFNLTGQSANSDAINFTENFTETTYINLTATNTSYNYWVYENFLTDYAKKSNPNLYDWEETVCTDSGAGCSGCTYDDPLTATENVSLIATQTSSLTGGCCQKSYASDFYFNRTPITYGAQFRVQINISNSYYFGSDFWTPVCNLHSKIHLGLYDKTDGTSHALESNNYSLTRSGDPYDYIWYYDKLNKSDVWEFRRTDTGVMQSYLNGEHKASYTINPAHTYYLWFRLYFWGHTSGDCVGCYPLTNQRIEVSALNYSGVGMVYNKGLDNFTPSNVQGNTIFNFSTDIISAKLTAYDHILENSGIDYYLSNNAGDDWEGTTANLTHIFTSTGKNLTWKAELYNTTPINSTPRINRVYISTSDDNTSNVNLTVGNFSAYYYSGQFIEDKFINVNLNQLNSTIDKSDMTYLLPIQVETDSAGVIKIHNINYSVKLEDIDLTKFNSSIFNNHLANNNLTNISFGMESGTLEVKNSVFTYPKDFNLTVTSINSANNSNNATRIIMVRYSQLTWAYPDYVVSYLLSPSSVSAVNVTPEGQNFTRGIFTITADPRNTDPFNVTLILNETLHSTINMTWDNDGNNTNGTFATINTSLTLSISNILTNLSAGQSAGLWNWAHFFNTPRSAFGWLAPYYYFDSRCSDCVIYV